MQYTKVKSRTYGKGGYFKAIRVWDSSTGGLHIEMYGTTKRGKYSWSFAFAGSKASMARLRVSIAQAERLSEEITSVLQGEYATAVSLGGKDVAPCRGTQEYGDDLYGLFLQDGKSPRSAFLDRVQMGNFLQALRDYVVATRAERKLI